MIRKQRKIRIAVILTVIGALLLLELCRSNFCLSVSYYQVCSSKVPEPVRILHLTDLHNKTFGKDNEDLLAEAQALGPDIILFTGDLVTSWEEDTHVAAELISELTQLAPVYISLGNHEQGHEDTFRSNLTALFEDAGAQVLEFAWTDVQTGQQTLRIGGFSGFGFGESYIPTGDARPRELEFLREFQDTENCTLLMGHQPAAWLLHSCLDEWSIDLVFSGHVHGGQFLIPGIGGVYGPDLGFFPGRLEGLFPSADGSSNLVLSRGLGNSVPVPRLNNAPQLLVLDIMPGVE